MAETIIHVDPSILKVHPRNAEFFDDVNGTEFDRLVESIRDHGVLTPLRVTKDMTIISGHQRTRAALKAECRSVPVIVDESDDDDDVLMKLIETNFGRMKNDPIKQARWVEEYEKLRGVRQGSAGNAEPHNAVGVTQADIAKELGVSQDSLQRLKSLLKLDPALQALISDGKINATTGFKILSKLSPEEQTKLLDKLPDDVKFSAKSIEEYVAQIRSDLTAKVDKAMQERDKLIGEKEKVQRENNELRSGSIPANAEAQAKQEKLEQERREYYEKFKASEKKEETLRDMLKEYNDEIARLKAIAEGGDDGAIALQNEIDTLKKKLEAQERRANDLEYQLEEKDDQIAKLSRDNNDEYLRKAVRMNETQEEFTQRERDSLVSNIQIAIGQFQSNVEGFLVQTDALDSIDKAILKVLVETCSDAVSAGNRLKIALINACGPDNNDDVFELDERDFDLNLGA